MDVDQRRETIVRLYGMGVGVKEIAERVGLVSTVRVYKILEEAGHRAGRKYGPRKSINPETVVATFHEQGSITRTAAAMEISQVRVRAILVEAGLVPATPRAVTWKKPLVREPWARSPETAPTADSVVSQQISVITSVMNDDVKTSTLPAGSRFFTRAQRLMIADLLNNGWSNSKIAAKVGKNKSSIGREIAAHSFDGEYMPQVADDAAAHKRRRQRPSKLEKNTNPRLYRAVRTMLTTQFSPEQISGRLRVDYPDDESMHVSHETIYQAIYVQGRGGLRADLHKALRSGRARRKPQGQRQKRERFVDPMVMISERPAEVEDRAVCGNWEGDLICGTLNKSAIGTLVERNSRYVILLHLPNGHGAEEVAAAIIAAMGELPAELARTLTWDQGSEMAQHVKISETIQVYFCDPGSPWQRGTNENTNGLLRQYFPKGTDLNEATPEDLRRVAGLLNQRPRKALDFATPNERFSELLSDAAAAS